MSDAAVETKKKRPKLLLMLVGGIVLGGAGLGGYVLIARKAQASTAEPHDKPAAAAENPATPEKFQIVTLKPIVVNLRNTKGTRYLKVTLGLQTNSKKAVEDLTRWSAQVSDFLVNKLSDLEVADVDTLAGRSKLKRDILNGINELLEGSYITGVFLTEFVIQ